MQIDACKGLAIIVLRVRHDIERDLCSTGSLLYKCRTPPNVSDLHSPAYPPSRTSTRLPEPVMVVGFAIEPKTSCIKEMFIYSSMAVTRELPRVQRTCQPPRKPRKSSLWYYWYLKRDTFTSHHLDLQPKRRASRAGAPGRLAPLRVATLVRRLSQTY